ncbi:MAG: transposase [Bacteroidota bacterium]
MFGKVEQSNGWLKGYLRIATRYEKLAVNFLAMVKLAFIRRYFKSS